MKLVVTCRFILIYLAQKTHLHRQKDLYFHKTQTTTGSRYSRIDQVKLVEILLQILLGPFLNTLTQVF